MKAYSLLSCLILLHLQAALPVLALEPKAVRWHSQPIGPDGPWNAVEVIIGNNLGPVALFPGRWWQTWAITTDYCDQNRSISHCPGGAYEKNRDMNQHFADIKWHPNLEEFMYGSVLQGSEPYMFAESFDMGFGSGLIPNVSMSLLDSQMMVYPGGDRYPFFAGCLSLGSKSANHRLALYSQDEAMNLNIIPWHLSQTNITASSSFGMHLGSAAPGSSVTGSLLYGGYDRSRAIGKVMDIDGFFTDDINLRDIGIRVVQGTSPFGFRVKDNLLAAGKSGLTVQLDPCSPYMTLPKSTCDSIAANLPVTYNSALGLYMWNTNDAKYHDIVNSASVLSFTMMSHADNLTINIPFQHLNLTLDPPLVVESAPYFPCHTGGTGLYVLGKAFFQDAFLGANWETRRWWLAQAPGPASKSSPILANIFPGDKAIYSASQDWESTWNDLWSKLARNHRAGSSADTSSTQQSDAENSSLSSGAKAGIGVGAGLVALTLILGGLFLWRRKTRQQRTAVDQGTPIDGLQQQQQPPGLELKHGPVEVDGFAQNHLISSDYHHAPMTTSTHQPRFTELPGYGDQMYELHHGNSRRRV